MQVINLPTSALSSPEWNANEMDPAMSARLYRSIEHFGLVIPLVVRHIGNGMYQTIGGAQRLRVLKETGADLVPCVVVQADDIEARLLSQSLNRIAGSDNLGLRAELLRKCCSVCHKGRFWPSCLRARRASRPSPPWAKLTWLSIYKAGSKLKGAD